MPNLSEEFDLRQHVNDYFSRRDVRVVRQAHVQPLQRSDVLRHHGERAQHEAELVRIDHAYNGNQQGVVVHENNVNEHEDSHEEAAQEPEVANVVEARHAHQHGESQEAGPANVRQSSDDMFASSVEILGSSADSLFPSIGRSAAPQKKCQIHAGK